MNDIVIKVENLSKQYRLGEVGTGTLSHDLNLWWYKMRGKADPYLKITESNNRATKGNSDLVWALKDIDFQVKQGEILGIIGKNGAGKSTLLKILSKVTGPTTGRIRAKGRIASLLEVGTGFHPELSGRENIYINGTLLGMSKKEVSRKLEEIVEFAGIARYLDTPTKRYSSGMTVRLGFAVAAHLEPEILIVDEVLAVGDIEFQKKAIGKMQDISKGGGRTVLFVSHNMGSIKQLCQSGILLANGQTKFIGNINDCVAQYLNDIQKNSKFVVKNNSSLPVFITEVELLTDGKMLLDIYDKIELKINFKVNQAISKHSIAVRLKKESNIVCLNFLELNGDKIIDKSNGEYSVIMKDFPVGLLKAGTYSFDFFVGVIRTNPIQSLEDVISFDMDLVSENNFDSVFAKDRPGVIGLNLNWEEH